MRIEVPSFGGEERKDKHSRDKIDHEEYAYARSNGEKVFRLEQHDWGCFVVCLRYNGVTSILCLYLYCSFMHGNVALHQAQRRQYAGGAISYPSYLLCSDRQFRRFGFGFDVLSINL